MKRTPLRDQLLSLSIGNYRLSFVVDNSVFLKHLRRRYAGFLVTGKPPRAIHVETVPPKRASRSDTPSVLWSRQSCRIKRYDLSFSGNLCSGLLKTWPNVYSFDSFLRLLLSTVLVRRQEGLLLHAAAVKHRRRGYVFLGRSGQGKSTLARMHPMREVLTDELALVTRESRGRYRVWGTPFWGAFKGGNNSTSAPLQCLAALEKGSAWNTTTLPAERAWMHLLHTTLFFDKSVESTNRCLKLCLGLARNVPCFTLTTRKQRAFPASIYAAMHV